MSDYENLEEGEIDSQKKENDSKVRLLRTILIVFSIIIILELISIFFLDSSIKKKNNKISRINYQKFNIDDSNKKYDRVLKDYFEIDYIFDEESKKRDKEIKSKDRLIKDYMKKSSRIKKKLNKTVNVDEFLQKISKIDDLKKELVNITKAIRAENNSKIIDSLEDSNYIKLLIDSYRKDIFKIEGKDVNLNMFYSTSISSDRKFDFEEGNNKLNFNETNEYLVLVQTNAFERYGIYINTLKNDEYLYLDLNHKNHKDKVFDYQFGKIKQPEKEHLKTLAFKVKEINFAHKNKDLDYVKFTNITGLEIYKVD